MSRFPFDIMTIERPWRSGLMAVLVAVSIMWELATWGRGGGGCFEFPWCGSIFDSLRVAIHQRVPPEPPMKHYSMTPLFFGNGPHVKDDDGCRCRVFTMAGSTIEEKCTSEESAWLQPGQFVGVGILNDNGYRVCGRDGLWAKLRADQPKGEERK